MKYLSFILLLLGIACSLVEETKISQWRGESRDGIYQETALLKVWPENGPTELWSIDTIGYGYGSPSISKQTVYVNGEVDSVSTLFAFDLNGKLKWKAANGPEFMGEGFSASFPGARSTPTIAENLAYISSGVGRIACIETTNGEEQWAVDMIKDLNGAYSYFGYSESLLVDGDKVFCLPGGSDTNMVALNRLTGDVLWVSKAMSDTASYCSPMLIELGEKKIVVNFTLHNLIGLDAETGKLLWNHEQKVTKFNQPSNTPVYKDGFIYYVQPDGNGAVKLKLSADGNSITEVWSEETEANTFTGFLLMNDKIYNTTRKMKMEVRGIEKGMISDSLRIKNGTIIAADDMLYCYAQNGSVNLIQTSPKLEIISKFKIKDGEKEHFSSPVIANGVLYVRHGNVLKAFDIKAE